MGGNDQRQLAYLRLLSDGLKVQQFAAEVIHKGGRAHLKVTNPQVPTLTERVFCHPAYDGRWCFWWPWRQPVGSVDDLDAVIRKIVTVLRTVEEEQ